MKNVDSTDKNLLFTAKTNTHQENVLTLDADRQRYPDEEFVAHCTNIVRNNVLDANMLYKIVTLIDYPTVNYVPLSLVKLVTLILSRNKLNAEQVRAICQKFKSPAITAAAIQTGTLLDNQVPYFESAMFLLNEENP